jgi:hypothetical protein
MPTERATTPRGDRMTDKRTRAASPAHGNSNTARNSSVSPKRSELTAPAAVVAPRQGPKTSRKAAAVSPSPDTHSQIEKPGAKQPASSPPTCNFLTAHLPAPLLRFIDFVFHIGDTLERFAPSARVFLHASFAIMLLSAVVLLVGGAAQNFKPLFGIELLSYKTPVIGPVIMQAQLVMYSWSKVNAVLGPGLIGLLLAYWGHPLVYLAAFMFYFIRNSIVYTFFVGIFVWFAGLAGTSWGLLLPLAPIVLAYARAFHKVHTLADTFPIMGASILASSVCFFDQMLSCLLTNVLYNRLVWTVGWKSFLGYIRFPLLFCYDDRAHGTHHWASARFYGCPSVSTHAEVLECICNYDLGCTTIGKGCSEFCSQIASDSNIYRLPSDYNTCLSIAHVFFCALVFALFYQALHQVQRRAIIHFTAIYGMYLAAPAIAAYNHFGLLTGVCYTAAVVFQTAISCRTTRMIGLDVSPPDKMPVTVAEVLNAVYAFARTVIISMPCGVAIPVSIFFLKLSAQMSFAAYFNINLGSDFQPAFFCTTE